MVNPTSNNALRLYFVPRTALEVLYKSLIQSSYRFCLKSLACSVCWSLQCLISTLTQGGLWWSLFLGLLVQSCCGEAGTLQTNITGVCSQWFSHTGFAPAHGVCAFPVYTAQALDCSAGNCLMLALGCMHSPGLSLSGSRVLHKGADLVGPAFCAHPRSKHLRWPGVWQVLSPPIEGCDLCLPRPSRLVFWMYNGCAFSGMPCVSSGELISGCNPPSGCQFSRIPRSLG